VAFCYRVTKDQPNCFRNVVETCNIVHKKFSFKLLLVSCCFTDASVKAEAGDFFFNQRT